MHEAAEQNTLFTHRISLNVNGTAAVLAIRDVGVRDNLEFICVIKTLTPEEAEGRTQLQVFSKTLKAFIAFSMQLCCLLSRTETVVFIKQVISILS